MEVSYHLVEQVVDTTILFVAGPGGWGSGGWGVWGWGSGPPEVIQPASLTAMYVGAMIIVGWGLDTAEVVTITGITWNGYIYTTAFVNSHSAGETILAPTFPSQQTTDPFFTQAQMLEWISRAQNEFLSLCPTYYALTYQTLSYGQIYQATPANCIEINRVAVSQYMTLLTSLTRTDDEVVAVSESPHGLAVGSTIFIQNPTAGFGGVFEIDTIISPTSFSYPQVADDGTATGGAILYFSRAYETTQAELSMTNRAWQNNYQASPTQWAEDRAGLYRWLVGAKPASNYPVELLCSIRDTDTLGLLDHFLISDSLCFALKWKVLAYALGSDNEQSDPTRAAYAESRFQRAVAATNRYLEGYNLTPQGRADAT